MIGAIAGDIIGSRFEGGGPPPDGFALFHLACRFTDDSVCTLAVAEAIMSGTGFAATLRVFVRRHPDAGYGGMFRRWAMRDDMPAYGSWGNGAPMRVAAVGWLADDADTVDRLAAAQAAVSHDHPDAIAAAQAVAGAILALRQGAGAADLRDRLAARYGYDLRPEVALAAGGFDVSAKGTAPVALSAALSAPDWETAVRRVIGLGGDTDTLACIAGAVAEARLTVPDHVATAARAALSDDLRAVLDRFDARPGPGH